MKKPNILFIFADQHRKFDLGCYGSTEVSTPNLDFLAENGLRFNHCVSNSPLCVPARGTLLTGLFANKHKAYTNDIAIDSSCESIADVLKGVGYHTGYIGKWHLNGIPRDQAVPKDKRLGFDEWKVQNCNHNYLKNHYYDENNNKHVVEGYEPEIFGGLAENFISHQDTEKPWALYLSFATPHNPHRIITDEYLAPYIDAKIETRKNVGDKVRINADVYKDAEEYKEQIKGYYGHISALDKQIGNLIELLRKRNELDNTIILFTADHGDMLASQGFTDKQVPYEESIAIPLIAYWKDKIITGVTDELIGLNDLPVTIASLADTSFKGETDGMDLSDVFLSADGTSYESAYLYNYFPCHNYANLDGRAFRGIRTKRYTYAVQADNKNWLLFDNEKDPYQLNNLAGMPEYSALQEELWLLLKQHIDKNDELLNGVEYVQKFASVEQFNESQRYFNLQDLANIEIS